MKNNEDIAKKIDELAATHPDEEYAQEVANDDPEKLAEARKRLLIIMTMKCKGSISPAVITGQLKPMVEQMSLSDCENMTKMIRKRGLWGLTMALKKQTKETKNEQKKEEK